jgi:hypothetical protein
MSVENAGLCSTCARVTDCSFPRRSGSPVIHCEEADSVKDVYLDATGNVFANAEATAPGSFTEKVERDGAKGLCGNCENRLICTYPRPDGGVWHCEEYK